MTQPSAEVIGAISLRLNIRVNNRADATQTDGAVKAENVWRGQDYGLREPDIMDTSW